MKEAIVSREIKVTVQDTPLPQPNADQVLIKVIVSGSNPKDWKVPEWGNVGSHNSGDDIAGIVEAVGDNVTEFKKGDRVAAFHEMRKPGGSFAEYAIAWAHTTFHLPKKVSFEEVSGSYRYYSEKKLTVTYGATIPLAAMTAALGLYLRLGLPEPWRATTERTPLIVYGGSGAVGAFAIKLAQVSNIHPIIAVAGRGQAFVENLIDRSKGDAIVDYRNGTDDVVAGIRDALKKAGTPEIRYAFDAVSEKNSFQNISQVLSKQGSKIALVLPGADYSEIPEYIKHMQTNVGSVHVAPNENDTAAGIKTGSKEFGHVFFRLFSRGLQEGWFTGHPFEVVPGGLNGVEKALNNLKDGVNSATKYVFRIEDTE